MISLAARDAGRQGGFLMSEESKREDELYARSQPPITARFAGGPLHLTKLELPFSAHEWFFKDAASGQVTEYFRITEANGRDLLYIFVARGLDPHLKNVLIQQAALLP